MSLHQPIVGDKFRFNVTDLSLPLPAWSREVCTVTRVGPNEDFQGGPMTVWYTSARDGKERFFALGSLTHKNLIWE
jgi:hypothetical protein